MIRPVGEDREPFTTSGTIAVVNLHAQIGGLTVRVLRAAPTPAAAHMLTEEALILIDLLTLRGHVLGRIADYERAAELAEQLVRGTPDGGPAEVSPPEISTVWLARARTRATAARYDELALRHPEAFAGHAVDFRRGCRLLQGISRG